MKKTSIAAFATAALLAGSLPSLAQTPQAPGPEPQARSGHAALFTPEERAQMREQLRNAKSRQERTELMRQFHERTAQRAQEQGVALPQRARNHGGAGATLFTPEERAAWRDRSRNAHTPEDRARIRQEYRAQLEQRAKDKGIALAQRGEERRGQERSGTALSLLTQEERTRIRERMRSAQTPQERAVLHSETRALIEQRAREKGIELRQYDRGRHRGHGGPQRSAA